MKGLDNMSKNLVNKIFIFIIIVLIVLLLIITLISNSKTSVIQMPKSDEIKEIINNKDVTIIDVRTKQEYENSHIKNAINIPYDEIQDKVKYNKDKAIAVYCKTGIRSHEAAVTLEKMGYKTIYDLGGIENSNIKLTTD